MKNNAKPVSQLLKLKSKFKHLRNERQALLAELYLENLTEFDRSICLDALESVEQALRLLRAEMGANWVSEHWYEDHYMNMNLPLKEINLRETRVLYFNRSNG